MQIAATGCIPGASDFSHRLSTKNKAADSGKESAATSIATTGQPPASHERAVVSIARRRSFEHCADRMARYKVIRHQGPHAVCAAPHVSERRATIDTLRTAGVPSCPRRLDARHASLPARAVHSQPGPQRRVNDIAQERTALPMLRRCLVPALEWDFKSSRASMHVPARTPTVRLDSWDFGPPGLAPNGASCDAA